MKRREALIEKAQFCIEKMQSNRYSKAEKIACADEITVCEIALMREFGDDRSRSGSPDLWIRRRQDI